MKGEWGEWLDEPYNKHAVDRLDYESSKREVCLIQPFCRLWPVYGHKDWLQTKLCRKLCRKLEPALAQLVVLSACAKAHRFSTSCLPCQDPLGLRGRMPPTQEYAPLHNEVLHNEAVSAQPYPQTHRPSFHAAVVSADR